jgi:hypothetical protein
MRRNAAAAMAREPFGTPVRQAEVPPVGDTKGSAPTRRVLIVLYMPETPEFSSGLRSGQPRRPSRAGAALLREPGGSEQQCGVKRQDVGSWQA